MPDNLKSQLEKMVDKMPAFPQSVQRVLEMTDDLNCSQKELVQVIEHDPVMTVKILKLLNSAYYNLPKKITSIKHSVVYIGFNTIKNMALSIATMNVIPRKNSAGFDANRFLLHSLSTATIAKTLGGRLSDDGVDKTDCFVGGLIHDFGKFVFAQNKPQEFSHTLQKCQDQPIALHQAELEVFGADHSLVGALLGERWRFPDTLIACMGEHHRDVRSDNIIADCVIAANQVSKKISMGHSGHNIVDEIPENVANRFGLGLDDLTESLGEMEAEKEEMNAFTLL